MHVAAFSSAINRYDFCNKVVWLRNLHY